MASIFAPRAGLRDRLATINGLSAYEAWPPRLSGKSALVKPAAGSYEESFGNDALVRYDILVAVPLSRGVERAQEELDAYLATTGTDSIRAAILGDTTLDGVVVAAFVRGWRDYGDVDYGGVACLGAIVEVECHLE